MFFVLAGGGAFRAMDAARQGVVMLPCPSHKGADKMYVFSRKKDESLVIGDSITVTVIEIRGDKVRLGIEYPPETSVHRREVYDAIQRMASPRSGSRNSFPEE
jgi:carbon storage regulator